MWALEWHSKNAGGERRHIMFHNGLPYLFRTRREALEYREKHFGYIRREDLRKEPHGWRLPKSVRVGICKLTKWKGQEVR